MALFMNEPVSRDLQEHSVANLAILLLNLATYHCFTRFVQNADSFTVAFLGDAQQLCCGFIVNIFVGKIEQKQTILQPI